MQYRTRWRSLALDLPYDRWRRWVLISVICSELTYLIVRYGFGTDAVIMADGGVAIAHQHDPFTDPTFSQGPAAAVALALLRLFLVWRPAFILVVAMLNLAGALLLLRLVVGNLTSNDALTVLAILPLTAAYRVGFADGQIAGLLLLLLVVARHLVYKSHAPLRLAASGLLVTVAIDLKPHVAFAFLVVFAFEIGLRPMLVWVFTFIAIHLAFDAWMSRWYETDWLHLMQVRSARAMKSGPEQSLWQLLSNTGIKPIWILLFQYSILIAAIVALALVARSGKISLAYVCAAAIPLLLAYQHLYDPIGLAVIVIWTQLRIRGTRISTLLLGFLLIPATVIGPITLLLAYGQSLLVGALTATGFRAQDLLRRSLILIAPVVLLGLLQIAKGAEPRTTFSGFLLLELIATVAFLRDFRNHISVAD